MKTFSLLCAAFVSLAALTPSTAGANPHCGSTRVSYDNCGRRVISVLTFVGRDYHGCPVYRWIAQPCRDYAPRPVYRGGGYDRVGYGRGGYDRGGHRPVYRGDRCDAPRGRVGMSVRFGR